MMEIIPNWHPIFVHFSVGLLLTSALFHMAAMFARNEPLKQTLSQVANWNLWVGTVLTVATVAAGWVAFNSVNHDTPSHLAMIEHRNWAMVTFAIFLGICLWSGFRAKKHLPLQWPLVIAVCGAGIMLMSTAWHGGELVYRHGLGVMSLPNPDEHAHEEGAAHDHGANEAATEKSENHQHSDHDHGHDQEVMQTPEQTDHDTGTEPAAQSSQETANPSPPQSEHTHEPGHEHHDH
jgi:uncharacterized membrane protein